MSESAKKPNQSPNSYSPHAPAIAHAMKNAAKNKMITTENGAYIDSVPSLGFAIPWRECTFSGCMTLILNALGAKVTYERVMGLTGSCYRVSMVYGWDPGSNILHITTAHLGINSDENANRYFGIDAASIDMDRTTNEDRVSMAKDSIDRGVPVLILGSRSPAEWGVLLGYEKTADGWQFFGRSYFDEMNYSYVPAANAAFTANQYVFACNFPYKERLRVGGKIFSEACSPTSALDALKASLETCLSMFQPHEKIGYGAYDKMIRSFVSNDFQTDWGGNDRTRDDGVASIIRNLMDARRAAYLYLGESAGLLTGENKADLLTAASLYKEMFDTLQAVVPYEKLRHGGGQSEFQARDFDQSAMTEETRQEFAKALRRCRDCEVQAHGIVHKILDNWETK